MCTRSIIESQNIPDSWVFGKINEEQEPNLTNEPGRRVQQPSDARICCPRTEWNLKTWNPVPVRLGWYGALLGCLEWTLLRLMLKSDDAPQYWCVRLWQQASSDVTPWLLCDPRSPLSQAPVAVLPYIVRTCKQYNNHRLTRDTPSATLFGLYQHSKAHYVRSWMRLQACPHTTSSVAWYLTTSSQVANDEMPS
ncbi:hypothetical protein EJ06DRAFT_399144 [Trichodelitschia bisporula]|uniref:Uncharacterized protein n=1 Tax=Trichodelitschia bisporula TaxID=703511 RepID=A0A6G1HXE0_9PEZI|nr:hypothetical protein EJ06DRAFT_399144 [Trichodelitschia bisporula]